MKKASWEKIDIDEVLDIDWVNWKPKTKIGKRFLKWAGYNLPRHMPIEDWNLPWAVCFTMAIEKIISQQISLAKKDVLKDVEKELEGLDCGFCNYESEVKKRISDLKSKK